MKSLRSVAVTALFEDGPTGCMTADEIDSKDYLNASLRGRGIDAHFSYVMHKNSGCFEFDLEENIKDS